MHSTYKTGDFRRTAAAIVLSIVIGSVALIGAVGPAGAIAPVAHAVALVA